MTRPSFEQALVKGAMGERIVRAVLEGAGWVVYQPMTEGAHAFDMLSIKDKDRAIAIDVKAKARMTYYHATGVNLKHFEQYKAFSERHNMPFWIIFVDEGMGAIYGNEIAELEQERRSEDGRVYPITKTDKYGKQQRLWALEGMRTIRTLSEEEINYLKHVSQRNYEYEQAASQ